MRRRPHRTRSGAVLPLIVVATLLLVAFIAYAVDVTRNIFAVQKLQFAAESAALDAYAQLVNQDGTMPSDSGIANAQSAVAVSHGSTPWNEAPLGPNDQNGPFNGPVSIQLSDVAYATNPSDTTEPVLRVTARREGSQALRFFFLPAIFAMNAMTGGTVPADAQSASPYRTIEVIGAPASRIGSGAPRDVATPSSTAGWATLPIALSYGQFLAASDPDTAQTQYIVDLLSSTAPYAGAAPANHIRGAFVNVLHTGSGSAYYGTGAGNPAISELFASWRYFGSAVSANESAPGVVERGSQLAVFDSGEPNMQGRLTEFQTALSTVPVGRHYIVPVISSDPIVGSKMNVLGFALLRLDQRSVNPTTGQFDFRFSFAPSYPVRNAASVMTASVPVLTGAQLPAPPLTGPFANRSFDIANNAVSRRFRGVAMAPVTSPRTL